MADDRSKQLVPRSMSNKKLANQPKRKSTQGFLDIKEIRDDVVVLNDDSLRAVIGVSSINFSLKSTEEQEAIIYQYQNFLNGLEFPIQIIVQSRRLNIDAYLEMLRDAENKQTSELLRVQTAEYRDYIVELIEIANIMTKNFYVTVSFEKGEGQISLGGGKESKLKLSKQGKPAQNVLAQTASFEGLRGAIGQRITHVVQTLGAMGIRTVQLSTQELIELYYSSYNPAVQGQQHLGKVEEFVMRQPSGGAEMPVVGVPPTQQ